MTKLGAVVVAMFGAIVIGGVVVVSQIPDTPGTQSASQAQAYATPQEIALRALRGERSPSATLDGSELDVTIGFSYSHTHEIESFERAATKLFAVAFGPPTVEYACLVVLEDLVDIRGHELPNRTVARACINRQQAYDIEWKNFNYRNIPKVVYNFWISPAWTNPLP